MQMEKISLIIRTTKKEGTIKLRFRLTDGRKADLYHKSEIVADLANLSKFESNGELKKGVRIFDKNLFDAIRNEIGIMSEAYRKMVSEGISLDGNVFERIIFDIKNPIAAEKKDESPKTIVEDFIRFFESKYENKSISLGRVKHYRVLAKELDRFLIINKMANIKTADFSEADLMSFRNFLFNEYLEVEKHIGLYAGFRDNNIPTAPRSSNTVGTKLSLLRSFFLAEENAERIKKSPFRKLPDDERKASCREKYDKPICLRLSEFLKVVDTEVPKNLEEVKDVFILLCTIGARIGDFSRFSMENIKVLDNIAYLRYLPSKTKKSMTDDIETPLLPIALDIIKRTKFHFPILKYVYGERGLNDKIKMLLNYCGIKRECPVFNEQTGSNEYIPLCDLGSSKLGRKTHINIMFQRQIDLYTAGLHSRKSDAVERYYDDDLTSKLKRMCFCFSQEFRLVDSDLNYI